MNNNSLQLLYIHTQIFIYIQQRFFIIFTNYIIYSIPNLTRVIKERSTKKTNRVIAYTIHRSYLTSAEYIAIFSN